MSVCCAIAIGALAFGLVWGWIVAVSLDKLRRDVRELK